MDVLNSPKGVVWEADTIAFTLQVKERIYIFCKLLRVSVPFICLGAGTLPVGWIHEVSLPTVRQTWVRTQLITCLACVSTSEEVLMALWVL